MTLALSIMSVTSYANEVFPYMGGAYLRIMKYGLISRVMVKVRYHVFFSMLEKVTQGHLMIGKRQIATPL